jgi:hypothetical protein
MGWDRLSLDCGDKVSFYPEAGERGDVNTWQVRLSHSAVSRFVHRTLTQLAEGLQSRVEE